MIYDDFVHAFERKPSSKEMVILNRLVKQYGEDTVKEAIRLSVVVTEGSPINYINSVCNNIFKQGQEETSEVNENLTSLTILRVEELKRYGVRK